MFCHVDAIRADQACPIYPLGVTEQRGEKGETFYASAFVRPFKDDEASLIEARSDAGIAARLMLKRDNRVPHGDHGRLYGVKDEGTCVKDGRVYSSVSVSPESAAQAIKLHEQLRKSFAKQPFPQIDSFSWTDDARSSPIK